MHNQTLSSNQTAYIEIRAATGGDEAKIWATDLYRMYFRYAQQKNWKVAPIDETTLMVSGEGVFELLKNEAGVHRVQRIPATERKGRIHTSTATVAVLPKINQTEIVIKPDEIEYQFYRSGGHGGQNVNKVSTAVRITHKPSGIVVTASEERFQERNREIAMELLRAKLWQKEEEKKVKTIAGYRSVIGRGMRAEKIRTYNFPQDRITDHRIGKSWGNLQTIIDGELDKILEATKNIN
ncbi:MAG: PCRF domain-containing protein [Patescibacteria group bacterium]|nr:PCRF domain-containing protein [Patescibacteria group bacterium]